MLLIRRVCLLLMIFGATLTAATAEEQAAPDTASTDTAAEVVAEAVAGEAVPAADAGHTTGESPGAAEGTLATEDTVPPTEVFPPVVKPPSIQGYDTRCWPIAARMATEPGALIAAELDLLQNCIAQLRSGVSIGEVPQADFVADFCAARTPACPPPPRVVCPPPPKPNLERLCPDFIDEQRQRRMEERAPVRARPHLPGS